MIAVRLAGGLAFDVLPDRGLDLGATWWGSTPVAWRSPNPVDPGPGRDWESRFLGGLLATCGPDNIGEPRGSSGQHGTHHLTPAADVRWSRERVADAWQVRVTGTVAHTSLGGPRILVERSVVASTGTPAVEVSDVVRNVGDQPVGVPLLYHVNLGAPFLRPGARLDVDADEWAVREPLPADRHPLVTPEPAPGLAPVVAEHLGVRGRAGHPRRRRAVPRPRRDLDRRHPAPAVHLELAREQRLRARRRTHQRPAVRPGAGPAARRARPCSSPARPGARASASPSKGSA